MTPLEKIEKLLLNDGRPSAELIDYKIDKIVDRMVDSLIFEKDTSSKENITKLKNVFRNENEIECTDNTLSYMIKRKDFEWLFAKVKNSLNRYHPYLSIDPRSDPLSQSKDKDPNNAENIASIGFCLLMKISPEIKKARFLEMSLDKNLADKVSVKNKQKI